MTTLQATLGHMGTFLLWVVLAGVIRRQRYREWVFFPIFVFSVAAWGTLVAFWHERFHVEEAWMWKEGLHHVFRLAMALELAVRTFRAFPGAMATLKRVLFVVLVITIAIVLSAAPAVFKYESFIGQFQPRILNAAVWLFTGIAALILWYRLPVSRFKKAIVLSYVPYLLVFTVYMNLLGDIGWKKSEFYGHLHQIVYLALLSYWAYAAWRRDPPPQREPTEPGSDLLVYPADKKRILDS
jgi:hypothetical protein